jgi:hypothetical protein
VIPPGFGFINNGLIGITSSPTATTITGTYGEIYIRNIGTLNPGDSNTITITGLIPAGLPDGLGLINLVQIISDQSHDNPQDNFDWTLTNVAAVGADLSLLKNASINTASI